MNVSFRELTNDQPNHQRERKGRAGDKARGSLTLLAKRKEYVCVRVGEGHRQCTGRKSALCQAKAREGDKASNQARLAKCSPKERLRVGAGHRQSGRELEGRAILRVG